MEETQITLGDIVSLKSHPYLLDADDVLISGEPLQLPPLMIVIEIFDSQKSDTDKAATEYTCLWFSSKTHKFERSRIKSIFLKRLFKAEKITAQLVKPGDLVSLTTVDYELSKKKSSLHFEDTSVSLGNGSSTINALLSFLPPILHCIDIKESKEKSTNPSKRTPNTKQTRSQYQVNCLWFNNVLERFSEEVIPLVALKIIPIVNKEVVFAIRDSIVSNKTVKFIKKGVMYLIKPRSITSRSGYYFLRGYEYLVNKITEIKIETTDTVDILDTPFTNTAPKFNITENSNAGSSKFILDELIGAIKQAKEQKAYVRIKYKNRNDSISIRSLKNYELIEGLEDNSSSLYLTGFCMLRQSERTFKISRVQNFQQLDIHFS